MNDLIFTLLYLPFTLNVSLKDIAQIFRVFKIMLITLTNFYIIIKVYMGKDDFIKTAHHYSHMLNERNPLPYNHSPKKTHDIKHWKKNANVIRSMIMNYQQGIADNSLIFWEQYEIIV